MRTFKITALALLISAATTSAFAQESLVDLVRAGQRDAVLAAITSPEVDVNVQEPDGSTALMYATYNVDHEMVRALLKSGAKADVTNNFGASALTEAVKLSDVELVRMLLDAGANPDSVNADNQTALMIAANLGSLPIAEMLIKKGAKVNTVESFRNQTALMWAAANNHPDIVELLIKNKADVTLRAKSDDWPRQMTSEPRAQFRNTGGLTALLYATRGGCYRCAVAIVEAGADINQPNPDGITPLINALDNRAYDIAMFLIDKGAKVDTWDMNGRTPIYVAVDMNSFRAPGGGGGGGAGVNFGGVGGSALGTQAASGSQSTVKAMDVVNRLLDMGVDPNHELTRMRPNGPGRGRFADYMMRGGVGPLMVATLNHDNEAMKALLAHGAEVDTPNAFRITPLMAAAGLTGTGRREGNQLQGQDAQARVIQTMDLLLDAGANVNAQVTDSHTHTAKLTAYIQGRDSEGRTALFAAAELGWDRVVQHLLDRGADASIKDATGKTALDAVLAPPRTGTQAPAGPTPEARKIIATALSQSMGLPVPEAATTPTTTEGSAQ
ncbi:MAG: ankyrin repeat domain-containing protein [Pseudomonadota bacterium]